MRVVVVSAHTGSLVWFRLDAMGRSISGKGLAS